MLPNLLPRFPRQRLLLSLIPVAAVLFSACSSGNPQDTFDPAGPVADSQAALFKLIFWIAVVVFILVEGGIIWITLRYRRRSESEMPVQTHGNTKLELTWTFIPTIIIIAIAIPTVASIWDLAEPPSDEPSMTVEAIGHQWWFEFRYPAEEIVTANELIVPKGVNVIVELASQDVIHSFWVPRLFGKVDMVPVRDNQLWFKATESGEYFGQCAEFCGIAHALMRFRVIVKDEEEYQDWVAGMRTPPAAPEPGSPAATGRSLFIANCSMCHTDSGHLAGSYQSEIESQDERWQLFLDDTAVLREVSDRSDLEPGEFNFRVSAPSLTHFGLRTTLGAGITDLNEQNLVDWLTDPSLIKEGTRMQERALVYDTPNHRIKLQEGQVRALADYLLSLVPGEAAPPSTGNGGGTPADPVTVGRTVFESNCSFCHSTGSNTITGPGLAGLAARAGTRVPGMSADDYIMESIVDPGAEVVDGLSNIMPGNFGQQLTDDEIDGLIAYLKTLN